MNSEELTPQAGNRALSTPQDSSKLISADAEKSAVTYLVILAICLAAFPCILGFASSGPQKQFVGAVYNIDDALVYDSWTRQIADGHFFIRNLFTTDFQIPIQFNLLFVALGLIVRMTGIPIPFLMFLGRLIAATGLLTLIYNLFRYLIPRDSLARISGLFLVGLGSGFGWIFWPGWSSKNNMGVYSVDTWQPEALTFQTIETSLLFTVSQICIVGVLFLLFVAQRTGKMRYAVCAGFTALVLGNIHSYDIVQVAAAWILYLTVAGIIARRLDTKSLSQACVAGIIALPSALYQLHMFNTDPVWHIRVFDLTLSPPITHYLLGWGFVLILAIVASILICSRKNAVELITDDRRSVILLVCWFAASLMISYLPHINFQRKLIMGADIPLSLLAGIGISLVSSRFGKRTRLVFAAMCVLLTLPTTILWLKRDIDHVIFNQSDTLTNPYISSDEVSAFSWIRQNTAPDSTFLGLPSEMIFIPGWCDRYTFASQWGETPNYAQRFAEAVKFCFDDLPEASRARFLSLNKIDYFMFSNSDVGQQISLWHSGKAQGVDFQNMPDLLQPVYRNSGFTIYKSLVPHQPLSEKSS